MQILAAIDSFKGSLSSLDAGNAVKRGILKVMPDARVLVRPLADGGEGTVDALASGLSGTMVEASVTGPLKDPVRAKYCILPDKITAVMEMSSAAGLTLVPSSDRNPLNTTTYGVGELIKDAIKRGCRRFIIGIGGSATNDAGTGMLAALGYRFLDKDGMPVDIAGKGLEHICSIDTKEVISDLSDCSFRIACDVSNPLCGPSGCSAVYGPQKGATPEIVETMDKWIGDFADLATGVFPQAHKDHPGTGAAGGLGFAFLTFTNATLESGISIILDEIGLEEDIKNSDLVITGEGRLDSQTAMGKAPVGVASLAEKHGVPTIAFAGHVTKDAGICNEKGITAFFPIVRGPITLEEAMEPENAIRSLEDAAEQAFRLFVR